MAASIVENVSFAKIETFEKCSILLKVKPPALRAYAPEGKTKI
jgi:hypothetical protein